MSIGITEELKCGITVGFSWRARFASYGKFSIDPSAPSAAHPSSGHTDIFLYARKGTDWSATHDHEQRCERSYLDIRARFVVPCRTGQQCFVKGGMHLGGVRSEDRVRRAVSGNDFEMIVGSCKDFYICRTNTLWQSPSWCLVEGASIAFDEIASMSVRKNG
jgi:hypothetical protein